MLHALVTNLGQYLMQTEKAELHFIASSIILNQRTRCQLEYEAYVVQCLSIAFSNGIAAGLGLLGQAE